MNASLLHYPLITFIPLSRPIDMGMSPAFSLLFSLFLLTHTCCNAFDITQILNAYPDFTTFNSYLSQTNLAAEINSRQTLTVLVVDNANMSPVSAKPLDLIRSILSVHVILDYYDLPKLQQLSGNSALVTTLFQTTGLALGQQGFLNVTRLTSGTVAFGSAMPGSPLSSTLLGSVVSQPYNISVVQVSGAIIPQGIDGTKVSSPPSKAPSATPAATPPPPSSVVGATPPPSPLATGATPPPTPLATGATPPPPSVSGATPPPMVTGATPPPSPLATGATPPPTPAVAGATPPPTPAVAGATPPPTPAVAGAAPPPTPAVAGATPPPTPLVTPALTAPATAPPQASSANVPSTAPTQVTSGTVPSTAPTQSNSAPVPSTATPTSSQVPVPSSAPSIAAGPTKAGSPSASPALSPTANAPGSATGTQGPGEPAGTTPAAEKPKGKSAGTTLRGGLVGVFAMVLSTLFLAATH